MPQSGRKKIVYLFGAGATHAELTNLEPTLIEEKRGLLIKNVSARVIEKARRQAKYLKDVRMVSATSGSLNIELLISLIENSKIHGWEFKTARLKELVQKDIEAVLTESTTKRFYLHKALLEFHKHRMTRAKEQVIGLISLNYDDVLDQAYREYYGAPNYCFSLEGDAPSSRPVPFLKLHGSFNWTDQEIRGRARTIEIIPLGSSKNYLHAPYSFIWNRALEILIECDTLRVIGCSLSQNDFHLIDLPQFAKKIEDFELTFVIYPEIDDELIREIFRRLQLGKRLNAGELLKTYTGAIRDFIYKEMGKDAPFLRHTNLSEKRFSRQFTLAQICINSFKRKETGDFVRARYDDLGDFFKEQYDLNSGDENLVRIREVLRIMDKHFGEKANNISSRAVAVSAYLYVEGLYVWKKLRLIRRFVNFYVKLLEEVKKNQTLLSRFKKPENPTILEEFQKYISQASVEPYAIKRRDQFLEKAFKYYLDPRTKGKIIGGG